MAAIVAAMARSRSSLERAFMANPQSERIRVTGLPKQINLVHHPFAFDVEFALIPELPLVGTQTPSPRLSGQRVFTLPSQCYALYCNNSS